MSRFCIGFFAIAAMVGSPDMLHAQLLSDHELAVARLTTSLQLGEHELNKLGPTWEIPPLIILINDGVAVSGSMERYAERVVELHAQLYNLNDAQKSKLMTAALLDVRHFCRRFAHAEVEEPQELKALRNMRPMLNQRARNVEHVMNIDRDLLSKDSLFGKMHAQLVSDDQREYAANYIVTTRQKWLAQCTWSELTSWMSDRVHISIGQWTRLDGVLKPERNKKDLPAQDFVTRFAEINPQVLEEILSTEQLSEIRLVLSLPLRP
jgi:hypothetical protein